MANALSSAIGGTPPAPNPSPLGNQMPQTMGAQGPGSQQSPPPPPNHQQTVVALRHFDAIEKELTVLLKDPGLGRADMKSEIIDGVTKLVAGGFLTPAAAITELATVPERPFDQKKWLESHLAQTVQAADGVLGHHGAAFAGQDVDMTPPNNASHLSTMNGLAAQYKGNA
jgi:hypothetical protein